MRTPPPPSTASPGVREFPPQVGARGLEQLFDQAPGFMALLWGPDHVFQLANPAYMRLVGHRAVLGRPVRDALPEAEQQGFLELLDRVYASAEAHTGTATPVALASPRGGAVEQRYIDFVYQPIRDHDGTTTGIFVEGSDVTERVEADRALKEREARLRLLVESATDNAIVVLDREGTITEWSAGAAAIYGWTSEEVQGRSWSVLFAAEDRAAGVPAADLRSAAEHRSARDERWHAHKDGSPIFMSGTVHHLAADSDGRHQGYLMVARNETERRRVAADLLALNDTLEARVAERTRERDRAWRLAQDLLAVVRIDGTFMATNAAWKAQLGWEESDLVGRAFADFTHPDDLAATLAAFADILHRPLVRPFEYRLRHREGGYRWFAWVGAMEDGQVYASGRSTTFEHEQADALQAAADQLRQSQKLEAIGHLTGGVAHDFNNLLTIIKSSSEMLLRDSLGDERRRKYVGAISETVARGARLTGQLLAFARRQTLKPEVFDVGVAVRSVVGMLDTIAGSGVAVRVDLPRGPLYVSADLGQFDTALVNLAANAKDAMGGQGELTISVRRAAEMPGIRSHVARHGDYVAISVADRGQGISAADMARIFEPFFTTKGVGLGTGLGLSQVFGFAKQSGGDIAVESAPGQGADFTLYLPRVDAAPPSEPPGETGVDHATDHDTCVLFVEDNAEIGRFGSETLSEVGFRSRLAQTAEEALDVLRADHANYDVVFSDVVMPGMSGIAMAKEIGRLYPGLPVVLTSGYSHVIAHEGAHGFELLNKPYSTGDLARVLLAARRRRSAVVE